MKTMCLWALVGLNVLLAILFLTRNTENNAYAQPAGGGRPGDYLMIPGDISGGPSAIVYIVDTTNGVLGGISYNDSNKALSAMKPMDLNRLFDEAQQKLKKNK